MPRGVKGSGPHSKVAKAAAAARRTARVPDDDDDGLGAPRPTSDVPTCRVCSAPMRDGGSCSACATRAHTFAALLQAEADARRCEICTAPAPSVRRGKRLCPLCRKLAKRAAALKLTLPSPRTTR